MFFIQPVEEAVPQASPFWGGSCGTASSTGWMKNICSSTSSVHSVRACSRTTSAMHNLQAALQFGAQDFGSKRLGYITFSAQLEHALGANRSAVCRNDDYWNLAEGFIGFEAPQQFFTVHFGHVDVGEDGINPLVSKHLERLEAVGRF